jgi:hypothetical protein
MNPSSFLPIGSMAAGLLALYVNPKEDPKKKWVLAASIIAVGLLTLGSGRYDTAQAKDKQDRADKQVFDGLVREKARDERDNRRYLEQSESFKQIIGYVSRTGGYSPANAAAASPEQVAQSLKASSAASAFIAALPSSSKTLRIEYFRHFTQDVDSSIVFQKLKKVSPSVQLLQFPPTEAVRDLPANCIWVGRDVTKAEARSVALILSAAGIELRDIRRLKDGTGPKARLIEIGASARVVEFPVMTADDIQKATPRPTTDERY